MENYKVRLLKQLIDKEITLNEFKKWVRILEDPLKYFADQKQWYE